MMWNKVFAEGNEILLATSSKKGMPNAIVVISQGFVGDRLVIAACQMKGTLKNIKETGKACVVGHQGTHYYRAIGDATVHESGVYFDTAVKRNKGPAVKAAIAVSLDEVFDLDKVKSVF